MIFVDSNIPMYLIGAAHPHKADAQRLLERTIAAKEPLVTDAEVLQEILHRYVAINRREAIQPAFDALPGIVDEVLPIVSGDVETAKRLLLSEEGLSARDTVHLAVMQEAGIHRIMSFDAGFDSVAGIVRVFD